MNPYLTFVVTARNDNYGGDFLSRMQLFVSTLAQLSQRYHLEAELLVVEWNPPGDRPPLREAIDWPRSSLRVRIVTVPNAYHRRLPNSERMPLFEWVAKNVGLRRASGEFVLATNPDIIFSAELIAHLAHRNLPSGCYHKVNRYDIGKRIPSDLSLDKMLHFCKRNVVRVWGKRGFGARFSAKVRPFLSRLRGFASRRDPAGLARWMWREIGLWNRPAGRGRPPSKLPRPHLGASGDFLLMSRQKWHELRGFPELTTHSYVDNYMVYLASAAGLKELVLPYRIYHQEHDRSQNVERPWTALGAIPAFQEMLETRRAVITNGDNWGLGDMALSECQLP